MLQIGAVIVFIFAVSRSTLKIIKSSTDPTLMRLFHLFNGQNLSFSCSISKVGGQMIQTFLLFDNRIQCVPSERLTLNYCAVFPNLKGM